MAASRYSVPKNPRSSRGFTLVEVVVALAIVAVGMLAVFKTIGDTVNNVSYLRDRSFAAWIADNRITEIRLSGEMPSVDETDGDLEYAGRRWHWTANVAQTPVEGIRRVEVRVRREDDAADSTLVSMAGFVGAIATTTAPSPTQWQVDDSGGEPGDEDEEENEEEEFGG